jgi:hypothetical protein
MVYVRVEQGTRDDLEGQLHLGGGDVKLLSVAQAVTRGQGRLDDLTGIALNTLAMECWCGDTALLHMKRLIRGDQALAEQNLHAIDSALFDEACALRHQNFANVFGLVDEDDRRAQEHVVGDVSVGPQQVLEQQNRAAQLDPFLQCIKRQTALQSWRHAPEAHVFHSDPRLCARISSGISASGALVRFRRAATIAWISFSTATIDESSRTTTTRCSSRRAMRS